VWCCFIVEPAPVRPAEGRSVPFAADGANYEDGERQESGKYYASGEGIRLEGMAGVSLL